MSARPIYWPSIDHSGTKQWVSAMIKAVLDDIESVKVLKRSPLWTLLRDIYANLQKTGRNLKEYQACRYLKNIAITKASVSTVISFCFFIPHKETYFSIFRRTYKLECVA